MRLFCQLLICTLVFVHAHGQLTDIAAIYSTDDELVHHLLFENPGEGFSKMDDAFTARAVDLPESYPQLTVTGDFTGDGLDEIAIFYDLQYAPNMNPDFTCSVIMVCRSAGDILIPSGTWFSSLDSLMDFGFVDFSVAADYNQDGLADIALFYNDPSSELQSVFVLESTGSGFSEAKTYYTTNRNEFNFTALSFACSGDFNGNGMPDVAVFYNYFGTAPDTKQSIFLFESNGNAFTLLADIYNGIKQDYDFSAMKFALAGDYNLDGYTDIAVLNEDPLSQNHSIPVFEGSGSGKITPGIYFTTPASALEFSHVKHALAGEYAGNLGSDLALFYDNPGTGEQEILVLESEAIGFKSPENHYGSDPAVFSFNSISTVQGGIFVHHPLVTATTWKDDRQGAISFTFDDGYQGAFENGAAELDSAGLRGTFYILTDTVGIYDAPLAGTSLIRKYRNRGFEIGSHTTNHSNLGLLTANQNYGTLTEVLANSVNLLNQRFDQQTFSMSIPYGSFRYETLEYISRYFYTARSSQFGFNLATPYDFFALRSWPVLSSSSPAFVDGLVSIAETYGYYLPLMYHDILNEPFDEDSLIYSYSFDLFRETIQSVSGRDVWIDTHERIYKYIRERNALKIIRVETGESEAAPGQFSFVASDGLADSIFNVELTLKIRLPDSWAGEIASLGVGDSFFTASILPDERGNYLLFNCLPDDTRVIHVYEGIKSGTGTTEITNPSGKVCLLAHPNPFRDETMLTIEGSADSKLRILVLDMYGRKVRDIRQSGSNSHRFVRNNLAPGLYILQLIDSGNPVATLRLLAE
ncbi:MAG: polysaccharide deacetylase family protein [Bacteroidales bacterium]|nr:polysaccharide deacetylase family protein [Bacteroidales bacterium]